MLLLCTKHNFDASSFKPFCSKVGNHTSFLVAKHGGRTTKNANPTFGKSIKDAFWLPVLKDFNCSPTGTSIYAVKDNIGFIKQQVYLDFRLQVSGTLVEVTVLGPTRCQLRHMSHVSMVEGTNIRTSLWTPAADNKVHILLALQWNHLV